MPSKVVLSYKAAISGGMYTSSSNGRRECVGFGVDPSGMKGTSPPAISDGGRHTDREARREWRVLPDGSGAVLVMAGWNRPDGPRPQREGEVVISDGNWRVARVGVWNTVWKD